MNRNATQARAGATGAVMALSGSTPEPVPSLPASGSANLLYGIAATSDTVWVVGTSGQKPLAARWDGTSWTTFPDPSESSLASAALLGARLRSVTCRPASERPETPPAAANWANGRPRSEASATKPGQAATESSAPDGGAGAAPDRQGGAGPDVHAIAAGRHLPEDGVTVIAVGGAYDRLARVDVGLIRHWTGSAWTAWDAPEALRGLVLNGVAFTGPNSAWAVGHASPHGLRVLRWDGTSWATVEVPDVPRGRLVGVAGVAPDDLWAVGSADRDGLVLHFDGRAWTRVSCPAKGPLAAVSAIAPDDVWAVGQNSVLHWNGRRWSRTKTPLTSPNTVTARARDDVWLAGGDGELAHYDGRRWTALPSPESTVWLASASAPDRTLWLAGTQAHEPATEDDNPNAVTAHPNDA